MDIDTFTKNFASQFDNIDIEKISSKTQFRSIEEWSSIYSLAIIAMVDEEYNVKLKGDDIRNSVTIEDLFIIVSSRQK